ncbi:MAG: Crp/Fnr family transcriptional regulator [Candidatus Izemoplasmatales bacterium]
MRLPYDWQTAIEEAGGTTAEAKRGALVRLQGDPCERIGYVTKGALEIRSSMPDGREWVIQTVAAGDFFGDVLTLACERRYLGNVTAVVDSTVVELDQDGFFRLLSTHPDALSDYLGMLGRKTFAIKQQVKLLSLPDLRSKILFWLRGQLGEEPRGIVPIPETKERLATFFAVERPSLSRELSRMRTDGLVKVTRKSIELL